jgi:GNAT superfamily N-acetyltransferase
MIYTRPAIAADRPFVVSGWSSTYRSSRDETAPASLYARHKHEEIDFYMSRAETLVAHGETGVLFGFLTYDPTTYARSRREVDVHGRSRRVFDTFYGYVLYVYVAAPFRGRGIARQLFAAAGINPMQRFGYLYRTRSSWELRSKVPLAEHEPFRARYEETEHARSNEPEAAAADGGAQEPGADPAHEDLAP